VPNPRDLRRRIKSVGNTQKLTKAMKMVAAAKLRRAQERILAARPFSNKMREVLNSLAKRVDPTRHPLLARRGDRRVEIVVVTADKGLCGGFNSNIVKKAMSFLEERKEDEPRLNLIGRKGCDFFRRRPFAIQRESIDLFRDFTFGDAVTLSKGLIEDYGKENLDAVYLIYNEFKSVLRQQVVVERLLPIGDLDTGPGVVPVEEDYIYEPDDRQLFDRLLPRHIEIQIYRALLESFSAEQAARMTAMEGATENAGEMIQNLTLVMNRVRQAAITTEIIEVVSGAEGL
jgi:F-type H+-transporting ATPase subunit gamma